MRAIVRTWKKDPMIRELAQDIIADCASRDWACEVKMIQEWVKKNIKFVADVAEVETLQTPDLTLRQNLGDCDDQSILVASLLQSIGHPARFIAVDLGGGFSHVFTETPIGPYWAAVETTEETFGLGDRPNGVRRTMCQKI